MSVLSLTVFPVLEREWSTKAWWVAASLLTSERSLGCRVKHWPTAVPAAWLLTRFLPPLQPRSTSIIHTVSAWTWSRRWQTQHHLLEAFVLEDFVLARWLSKGAVVGTASGEWASLSHYLSNQKYGFWELGVWGSDVAGKITSLVFSFHNVFLMASHTNLCYSFLDKFMLNSISAISISCLFRISCFWFSQPCGVNLSYEIQISFSCFLSCNTSFSSSQLFVGFMGCTKLAGGTRGLRGRLAALFSPRANSNPFIWATCWCMAQYFWAWTWRSWMLIITEPFFFSSTLRNNIPVGQRSNKKALRR